MKRLAKKGNICIVNGESNKYEGLWAIEKGEEKSVTDYAITTNRDLNTLKTMKIDEEKEFGIYKAERQGTRQCRKICSDCNVIMLNIDFISKMEAKYKKKIITKKVITRSTRNS